MFRRTLNLLRETFTEWDRDNAMQLAAALAFYMVFSFAPLLVLLVAAASFFFGGEAAKVQVIDQLQKVLSQSGARMVQTVLQNARPASTAATIVGLTAMLFGATAVFVALQNALNWIWGVTARSGNIVKTFLRKRLTSFFMLLAVGALLLASTIFGMALSVAGTHMMGLFSHIHLLNLFQFGISFALITILVGIIFKVLPDAKIAWKDVWLGALFTSLLFNLGKMLLGIYLARSTLGSLYGAAGSFAVFLIWIFYSAQAFLFGAEFTQVYARKRGTPIIPDENAVAFKIQTFDKTV